MKDRKDLKGVEELLEMIYQQDKRLAKMERSGDLSHSAVDNGGIVIMDENGNPAFVIGPNEDGTVTPSYPNGPTPLKPSSPMVESGIGTISVGWDGLTETGLPTAQDFRALNIFISLEQDFTPDVNTFKGAITSSDGGTKTITAQPGTYYVRTAIITMSGKLSVVSDEVVVDVINVTELPDLSEAMQKEWDELGRIDQVLEDANAEIEAAKGRIDSAENQLTYLDDTYGTVAERLDQAEEDLANINVEAIAEIEELNTQLTANTTNLEDARTRLAEAEATLNPLPGALQAAQAEAESAKTAAQDAASQALAAASAAAEANARAMSLLANGGFEDGLNYWETTASPALVTDSHSGTQAVELQPGDRISPESPFVVSTGNIWELSFYTKSLRNVAGDGLLVQFAHAGQAETGPYLLSKYVPLTGGVWKPTGAIRFTVPEGMDLMTFRVITPWATDADFIVDDFNLRDVTDVVRLEKAAQEATAKAQNALDAAQALETRTVTLELAQGGIQTRLDQAESDITTVATQAADDLSDLNTTLTNTFTQGDTAVKQAVEEYARQQAATAESNAATEAARVAQEKANAAKTAAEQAAKDYADLEISGASDTVLASAKAHAEAEALVAKNAADAAATAASNAATKAQEALERAEEAEDTAIAEAGILSTAAKEAAILDAKAKVEAAEARSALDAQTKANKALADAKTDATSKANAAQQAAITAAKADAKAQAESAEARAATEALRLAKIEAQREANEAETAAKLYADAQASGASGSALTAAKLYAEEQAEEARIAAELAASLDATAKAEQAEADAAIDAKNKADKALADAKADATTKANEAERLAKVAAAADAKAKVEAAEARAALDAKNKADKALADAKADATAKTSAALATAASTAQTKADAAQAEALRLAKIDSSTKADAAEKEAVRLAAIDAKAKADAATAVANGAHTAAGVAWTYADSAMTRAGSAETNAKNHADAMPKILHGTTNPTGTAPNGSIWWKHKGTVRGAVIGQWNRDNGSWISTPIDSEAIANLDVGKLTAGSADIDTAVVDKLYANIFAAKKITAEQMTISSGNLFPDPNFENPLGYSPWTVKDGGIEKSGTGTQSGSYKNHLEIPVQPGDELLVEATRTTLSGTASGGMDIYGQQLDANGVYVRTAIMCGLHSDGAKTGTYKIPAGIYSVRVGFYTQTSMSSGTKVRIDNVRIIRKADTVSIADGAITADKITVTGELTADILGVKSAVADTLIVNNDLWAQAGRIIKLDVGNLTATGSSSFNTAVANQIFTDVFAANKITAEQIAVPSGDLIADPSFENGKDFWTGSGTVYGISDHPIMGNASALRFTPNGSTQTAYNSEVVPTEPDTEYLVEVWVKVVTQPSTHGQIGIGTTVKRKTGSDTWTTHFVTTNATNYPTGVWKKISGTATMPANAKSVQAWLSVRSPVAGGQILMTGLSMRPKVGGTLIKNGEINAEHITASKSLTTKVLGAEDAVVDMLKVNDNLWAEAGQIIKLDAGSLTVTGETHLNTATANLIWSEAVRTKLLTATEGLIGGVLIKDGAIDGKTITGAKFQTHTDTFTGVKMDSNGIRGYGGGKEKFKVATDGKVTATDFSAEGEFSRTGPLPDGSTGEIAIKNGSYGPGLYVTRNGTESIGALEFNKDWLALRGKGSAPGIVWADSTGVNLAARNNASVINVGTTNIWMDSPQVNIYSDSKLLVTAPNGIKVRSTSTSQEEDVSTTGGWNFLNLVNGWSSFGQGFAAPQWRREGNSIRLRGVINGAIATTTMATLPSSAHPTYPQLLKVAAWTSQTAPYRLNVSSTGAISQTGLTTPVPAWISLDGITFPID